MFDRRDFLRLSALSLGAAALARAQVWLPDERALERRRGPARKVIILGAGIAGLVAGYELKSAGHEVIILEAQLRPGGRVQTIREPLSDGIHAEAGAGRIPSTHAVAHRWIEHFALELEPFYPAKGMDITLLGGKRLKASSGGEVDITALEFTPAEKKAGLSGLDELYYGALLERIGEAIDPAWPPDVTRLGDVSFQAFLRQRGASEAAIRYLSQGFEEDSALDMLRDLQSHRAPSMLKIKDGNDRLPRAFAAKLSEEIRYGTPVVRIERGAERVRVTCLRGATPETLEGDYAVCTIPYGVLRRIEVTPPWPDDKRQAIEGLRYGSVVRMTFQCGRRFWEDEALSGFATTDTAFEVWSPTFSQPGTRGLLQSYIYEDRARQIAALSEEERVRRTTEEIAQVHPGVRKHLEAVISKCWDNDPWARGAFTIYAAGEHRLYPLVCRREGRILFAGEHASPWPGWIQGALVSGMKAAREINEAVEMARSFGRIPAGAGEA